MCSYHNKKKEEENKKHKPTRQRQKQKGRAEVSIDHKATELPPGCPPVASPSLGFSQCAVFIHFSYRTATSQDANGFTHIYSLVTQEVVLFLPRIRKLQERILVVLDGITAHPCVCVISHTH